MSIRITGRYIPGGVIKMRRALVALPVFLSQPDIQYSTTSPDSLFTARPGTFTPSDVTVSYRWLLNNIQISTGETVTPNAVGSLVLEVTLTKSGGSVKATTAPITLAYAAPAFTLQPSISPSSAIQGTTFTANNGTITGATSVTRQWLLNGVVIRNQTGTTYVSDGTGALTLRVTAVGPGGTTVATSAAVTINPTPVVQNAPEFVTLPGLLGTFAEGTSISIPINVSDVENNVSTWTVTGGELPSGVTLDMFTGVIAGQLGEVTADVVFSFKIKVTDRTGLFVEGTFSINVANVKSMVTWETDNSEALAQPAPGEPIQIKLQAKSV